MPKNYYIILGIPADSSQDDIKAAYRRLAKEYHPDHSRNNHSPFLLIHEAYSVLSDPSRRLHYDADLSKAVPVQTRSPHRPPAERRRHDIVEPLVPSTPQAMIDRMMPARSIDSYNTLLDGLFDSMLSSFSEHRSDQTGVNTTIEVTLTKEQARNGGNLRLRVPIHLHCPNCRSWGSPASASCWRCGGSSMLSGDRQILLSFPPGVTSGHTVALPVTQIGGQDIRLYARFTVEPER